MISLSGQSVFLSASFPSGNRGEDVRPYDPSAIADAVTAIVRAVLLSNGKIVFGGHPTITPIILMIGTELKVEHSVDVFQSEWFESQITEDTFRLINSGVGDIHWTGRRSTLEASLTEMRLRIFESANIVGAVFVGGMSGIRQEYELIRQTLPGLSRIPVAGPGGAAAQIARDHPNHSEEFNDLLASRHYPFVASQIVELFARQIES